METILLGSEEVKKSVRIDEIIEAVEEAFVSHHKGDSVMPSKSYIQLPEKYNGDFRAMPAYVKGSAGVKWVNVHPKNPEKNQLPTVMGVMIYSDPETAFPLAIMDGTTLTRYRTGGASGVATKYLAPKNASTLGIVGAGIQSHTQLQAISEILDLEKVIVYDIDKKAVENFIQKNEDMELKIIEGKIKEISKCDVISTLTPSKSPILTEVKEGCHINAIGADAPGKQEIKTDILKNSKIIVDNWEQCSESGEINTAISKGILKKEDIYGEIGEIVTGELKGRDKKEDITIFDSTGLAVQDVTTSRLIYEKAREKDIGTQFDLIEK